MRLRFRGVLFPSVLILSTLSMYPEKKPPRFFIDKGACPFECCTYRTWKTEKTTSAYASPSRDSRVVGRFAAGTYVEALTGEVHTTRGRFKVRKTHGRYKPGDVIWVYTYLGEGFFKVWFEGELYTEGLGFSPYGGSAGTRCERSVHCWGELDEELNFTWWIKIKSADGWVGWTDQGCNFSGSDACG